MQYKVDAACYCHIGHRRENNEDNFFFQGIHLSVNNRGLWMPIRHLFRVDKPIGFAVLDGMGGEEAGEVAAHVAVKVMRRNIFQIRRKEQNSNLFWNDLCDQMNAKVCEASSECKSGRLGTTFAGILFQESGVSICNIGDSRIYRLRNDEWMQLSLDHLEDLSLWGGPKRKPRLSQHLGIFPDELQIVPHILKIDSQKNDEFILCSDGLTDMLTDNEIYSILHENTISSTKTCVRALVGKALKNGGKDNVTVVVCRIK